MSFSASMADERVLDVQFTDDAVSVNLRDGRVITVPLVWYIPPLQRHRFATKELEDCGRGIWDSLARLG